MISFLPFILLSVIGTILGIKLLKVINISALPSERSSHKLPTPTAGGSVIIITFFANFALLSFFYDDFSQSYIFALWLKFLISALILGGASFLDDYKGVSYKARLMVHITCGLILLWPLSLEVNSLLMVLVIIGLINATNFVDGLDGLLSGCWLIGMPFTVSILLPKYAQFCIPLFFIYLSALVFFFFNFPKAKIFLGDVGSTFLGLTFGMIAVFGQTICHQPFFILNKTTILLLLPFSFLWFDVAFTLIRRILYKKQLTYSYRDYLFHKLNDKGFSHAQVSSAYFGLTFVMGLLTYLYYMEQITFLFLLLIYAIIQISFTIFTLKR